MTPKVSVVIPVYNAERYLEECLNSVLASTLDDIEVICVDDCSPDRCPQMLDEYAERDQRIQVVHLSGNGGPGNARNIGLSRACGQYVYFLDADDMIVPAPTSSTSCGSTRRTSSSARNTEESSTTN